MNGLVVVPMLAAAAVTVVHLWRWVDARDRRRRHDAYVQRVNALIAARPPANVDEEAEDELYDLADEIAAADTLWFHPHPRGGYVSTSERAPWTQP